MNDEEFSHFHIFREKYNIYELIEEEKYGNALGVEKEYKWFIMHLWKYIKRNNLTNIDIFDAILQGGYN